MLYFDYEVVYYMRASGRVPVKDYVRDFDRDEREEIHASIKFLLKHEGKLLPPCVKHIYQKIWGLRIKYLHHHHRILYFIAPHRKIVLLSAFLKKTKKTPRSEIKKAYKYYFDYLSSL